MFVFLLVCFVPSFLDFLLLLFNQERFHRVVVIVIVDKLGELSFFLQHWPLWLFIVAVFVIRQVLALFALEIFPSDPKLVLVLVVARLVPRMVYSNQAPADFPTAKVIYCKVAALLVFVLEPTKAF